MLTPSLLVVLSLLLLFVGAEGLVRGSSSLALRAGITPLVVGLTVVAFGTSSPELVVGIKAALLDQGNIAVGNVVGSNLFNIGVILGLTALLCPIPVQFQLIKADVPVLLLVSILLPVLLVDGELGRLDGLILFGGVIIYSVTNIVVARRSASQEVRSEFAEGVPGLSGHWVKDLLFVVAGLGILILGSRLLVDNSVIVARSLGISEAVIGLTVIAAGTSMPELVTSVVAAFRREPDIAVGNVIGSNIFNVLGILGTSSLVHPMHAEGIRQLDYLTMIGISIALLPMLWSGLVLRRIEGLVLMGIYGIYLAALWPK